VIVRSAVVPDASASSAVALPPPLPETVALVFDPPLESDPSVAVPASPSSVPPAVSASVTVSASIQTPFSIEFQESR